MTQAQYLKILSYLQSFKECKTEHGLCNSGEKIKEIEEMIIDIIGEID